MNLRDDLRVIYLTAFLLSRLPERESSDEGASAIEWAIITGITAAIAIAIGVIIYQKINTSANNIDTNFTPPK
jgi:Flp pilus assembly pilin Flp